MRDHLRRKIRRIRRRIRHFLFHSVLHADDPPHRLALGIAIGVFVTFTPTVGLQMMIVVFLAWLLGANKIVGLPVTWITNPATIMPIFYTCYRIGRTILGQSEIELNWWAELANRPDPWWPRVQFYWNHFMEIAAPLWVGSMVIAPIVGYVAYYISYYAIAGYRMRRWGQLMPPPPKLVRKPKFRFRRKS